MGIREKSRAVIAGVAVGDALGGATEGWSPEQIRQRWGGPVTGIVEPYYSDWKTARPIAPYHKGDGHVTDDTLMTRILIDVYASVRRHLTAYDMASEIVPRLIGEEVWIPELEESRIPLQRLFLAEKWIVTRLHYGHIDPREAGVGNIVNCGAAMYMAPVGIVNAGDAAGAYAEAIDLSGAHQSSYGREAAGVFAAAVAQAMVAESIDEVVDCAIELSHDGTRQAIIAVAECARSLRSAGLNSTNLADINSALRDAIRPYDTVGDAYREMSSDARRPSRTKAIEELPVALGLSLVYSGNTRDAIVCAVNYGRDSDSIAVMTAAVCAGLTGLESIPKDWIDDIGAASQLDILGLGDKIADAARDIIEADVARLRTLLETKLNFETVRGVLS
ncbi:ADP-ribosylglycohydrolase family protein [Trueperella sp. LYQ143]|uniref:ADP-ribosylglycohydrolase family protein n=1 Tax=unclassified Trueperella TaxID=2630174 RepID=UPI003983110A